MVVEGIDYWHMIDSHLARELGGIDDKVAGLSRATSAARYA
jgi:hypothetical protein